MQVTILGCPQKAADGIGRGENEDMSAKTYALRDIVLLLDEAIQSFGKTLTIMNQNVEKHGDLAKFGGTYKEMVDGYRDAIVQMQLGIFRLGVGYEKLVKGAKLEEEKAAAQKKSEEH